GAVRTQNSGLRTQNLPYECGSILINSEAIPRNDSDPPTSVNVVTNTVDATAGSTFIRLSTTGMRVPASAATIMFTTIEIASTMPSQTVLKKRATTIAPTSPFMIPLPSPTTTCLNVILPTPETSLSANPRMITVRV